MEIDLAEQKSTGITKILNALERNGSPLQEFETDEEGRNYLETTFYIHEGFDVIDGGSVNGGINGGVSGGVNINEVLSEKENELIEAILLKPETTASELASKTGIAGRTIERMIKTLNEKQVLARVGSKKTGHWVVRQK